MAESLQQNAGNDVCRSVDDELSLMSLMTFPSRASTSITYSDYSHM